MSEPMAPAAETHDAALGPESPLEPAYSLLSEPWLSVRWLSGSTGSVGLRELFARSHELAEQFGEQG